MSNWKRGVVDEYLIPQPGELPTPHHTPVFGMERQAIGPRNQAAAVLVISV
jgi:hypothetical protein